MPLELLQSLSGRIATCHTPRGDQLGDASLGRRGDSRTSSETWDISSNQALCPQFGTLPYPIRRGSGTRFYPHDLGSLVRVFSGGQGDGLFGNSALTLHQESVIPPFLSAHAPGIQRSMLGIRGCPRVSKGQSKSPLAFTSVCDSKPSL